MGPRSQDAGHLGHAAKVPTLGKAKRLSAGHGSHGSRRSHGALQKLKKLQPESSIKCSNDSNDSKDSKDSKVCFRMFQICHDAAI